MNPVFFPIPRRFDPLPGQVDTSDWRSPDEMPIQEVPERFRNPEAYRITLSEDRKQVEIGSRAALPHAWSHLRQWQGDHPRHTPCGILEDAPVFSRRGYMLDISRCKVPTLDTLKSLVALLARFRYNELQLYTEHTFAYRSHADVWREASPITPDDIRELQACCRSHGIDLVPNQNSFGHFERWLKHPAYREYAESPDGFTSPWGERRPVGSVLKPDAASRDLVCGLHDELLPLFDSGMVNIGCDETFELGQGASRGQCERDGMYTVYTRFVADITRHIREVHHKQVQFWGDILLKSPDHLRQLPGGMIALEWGYEAGHPFLEDAARFKASGLPFYVCPGTSAWNSFGGRTDNMIANIREAVAAGMEHGAMGLLLTDWGDNGHLQQEPVSWPALAWAGLQAWNPELAREEEAWSWCDREAFDGQTGATRAWLEAGRVCTPLPWNPGNANAAFALFTNRPLYRGQFPLLNDRDLRELLERIDALPRCPVEAEAHDQTRRNLALGVACELCRRELKVDLPADLRRTPTVHADLWRRRNREGGLAESLEMYHSIPHSLLNPE